MTKFWKDDFFIESEIRESWIGSLAFDPNVLSIVIGGNDEKVLDPDVYSVWKTSPAFIFF